MKKMLSDVLAGVVIGVLCWVGWWIACVIETGIAMPRSVFYVMCAIYSGVVLCILAAVVYGILWIRRRRSRRSRCLGVIWPDGKGGFTIKK